MNSGGASEVGYPLEGTLTAGVLVEMTAPVTVIVPAHGPGPNLQRMVNALQRQSPPVERIILSHSGDGDPRERFAGTQELTVLHSPERLFAGAARNRAVALAETDWVAFVDEDVIVDDTWHAALLAAIARGRAGCIAGSIGYAETGGYWGMSLWFAEFGPVHPYRASQPISSGASANLAMRRELLLSIGGFREDWPTGEDSFAQAKLEVAGYGTWFEPEMAGRHVNLPGLRRMLRHSHRLGRYSARQRRIYPHLTGAAAVRWPVLSLGMWLARLCQIHVRVLTARSGPAMSLLWHTPGILISVLAWNLGFAKEAFGFTKEESGG